MLDLLCVADLCIDFIVTGNVVPRFRQFEQLVDDYAIELGGSGTIFGGQFAKLGGRTGLIGALGEDPFGRIAREKLLETGVETGRIETRPGLRTGLGLALVKPDGDRATLTCLGSIDAVGPDRLTDDLLAACCHWHLASYFLLNRLRGEWVNWLARCRAAGLTTSMDPNWDPEDRWEGVAGLMPLIDVFIPNEAEALAIAREAEWRAAGRRLSALGPLVVIKRGEKGAAAFQGNQYWEIPPAELERPTAVVDAVGAGDNFAAAFVRAWLLGWDVARCLGLAHRCAVASLAAPGGFQGQLREKIEA